MTIFLTGPTDGYPQFNTENFALTTTKLRESGFDVVNSAELCPQDMNLQDKMRIRIAALLECDSIAMLPGWASNKAAQLELQIAKQLEMDIYDVEKLMRQQARSFTRSGLIHVARACATTQSSLKRG